MAISARFEADFKGFIEAVDKAELKLVDLNKGSAKVEATLNKMSDAFSGRRIIQEASLLTIAIEKAGGISKLTAKELEQVGAKANDAADKLKRLGYEVPVGLQKLADETKNATAKFGDMKSMVTSLAGAFGVGLSIGAVVSFGKQVLADADALVKLHDKTGISVEGLQRFQVAGDDAGNTLDDITNAITKMEDKLVSGDSSAAGALKKFGLSFEDLKGLSPENQFIKISDAIRDIKDPAQQVNIAIDLFGKQGASVLPTLKRGFDDLKDSAVGMSKETVKALDDAGDTMARWWRQTKGVSAEFIVAFGRMVSEGFSPWEHAAQTAGREARSAADAIEEMYKRAAAAAPKSAVPKPLDLKDIQAKGAVSQDKFEDDMKKAKAAADKAAEALKKFKLEVADVTSHEDLFGRVVDSIDGKVLEGIRFYHERGAELTKLGIVYGLTAGQVKALDDQFKFEKSVTDATAKAFGGMQAQLIPLKARFGEFHEVITGVSDTTGLLTTDLIDSGTATFTFANQEAYAAKQTEEFRKKLEALDPSVKSLGESLHAELLKIPQTIANAFTGGGGVLGGVKAVASGIGSAVGGSIGFGLGGPMGAAIGSAIGSLAGPLIGGIAKLFTSAEKQINPVREAFVQLHGGLANLNLEATRAGTNLWALLQAKNAEQYQKAIDDLNAAFQRYDKWIQDSNTELVDLLRTGQNIGAKLPASMQPSIDKLIEMGRITGDNAELLKSMMAGTEVDFKQLDAIAQKYGADLSTLGPKFKQLKISDTAKTIINDFDILSRGLGDVDEALRIMRKPINDIVNDSLKFGTTIPANMKPWVEQLEKTGQLTDADGKALTDLSGLKFADPIVTEFDKLIKKLDEWIDKLSNALPAAINGIPNPKPITIPVGYRFQGDLPEVPIPMASGGMGRVTKPTLFLAGEAGAEDVAFSGGGKSFSGGRGGGDTYQISIVANDTRGFTDLIENNGDAIARAFSRAVLLNKGSAYTMARAALGMRV